MSELPITIPDYAIEAGAKRKRSSKYFPSTSCTAWEDCWHDEICHDPKACKLVAFRKYARNPFPAQETET